MKFDGPKAMAAESDERTLAQAVNLLRGSKCEACAAPLCGHMAVINVMLGLATSPRCLPCLAKGLEHSAEEFRDQAWSHVSQRDCFRNAWLSESKREGFPPNIPPRCLWPDGELQEVDRMNENETTSPQLVPAATWDAGDLGCGDLVLALRGKLNALPPGGVLRVIALDPAAPEDLPAWCRLTGNRLLRSSHPSYDIQRKGA